MAYQRQEMRALIELDPVQAKKRIEIAYQQAGANLQVAAQILQCAERTLHRWIVQLGLKPKLDAMKDRAKKNGSHHTNLGGRPPKHA